MEEAKMSRLPLALVVTVVLLAGIACNRSRGPQVEEEVAPAPAVEAAPQQEQQPAVEQPSVEEPAGEAGVDQATVDEAVEDAVNAAEDQLTDEELEALENELDALFQEFENSAAGDPNIPLQ